MQSATECFFIPTAITKFIANGYLLRNRVPQGAFERLELLDAKVSRAVLRGGDNGNIVSLPDYNAIYLSLIVGPLIGGAVLTIWPGHFALLFGAAAIASLLSAALIVPITSVR